MKSLKKEFGKLLAAFSATSFVFFYGGYKKTDWPVTIEEWVLTCLASIILYVLTLWLLDAED